MTDRGFFALFTGEMVQERHAPGADRQHPDVEPLEPPHPHPQLDPVGHGLCQLLLRRGELPRDLQVSSQCPLFPALI